MPNPKNWFLRRRSPMPEGNDDPLNEAGILDLGRIGVVLRDTPAAQVPPPHVTLPLVPAPPAAASGRVLPSSAFALRPQITRRDAPPGDAPPEPPRAPSILVPPRRQPAPGPERREPIQVERREAAPPERREPLPPERREPPPAERRAAFEFRLGNRKPPPAAPAPPAQTERAAPADPTAFTLAAPGPSWIRGRPKGAENAMRMHALLRDAFTPTRPKHDARLFSGRFREMERIIAAIEEERAHVVVYGERGSGKTSLCNILAGKASEAGYFTLQYACSSGVTFEEIFRNLLRRVPTSFLAEGLGVGSRRVENFAQLLPEPPYAVSDLVDVFARIHDRHCIFIIDEYDRVTGEDVKARLAELIKIMSDAAVPVTLLLIGVADDVRELFGKHPSLQRTLVTVPMPMMSRRDIEGLIAAGETHAGLAFAPDVRRAIVDFAQGLPYQAQLLCLFAARNAVRRGSQEVEREDLRYAVARAGEEAESRIKEAYEAALGAPLDPALQDVLYAAARAPCDEYGAFTAADVASVEAPAEGEAALAALLQQLATAERGHALRRIVGIGGPRYQFASHMFRNYVLVAEAVRRETI